MTKLSTVAATIFVTIAAAACTTTPATSPSSDVVDVRQTMVDSINPSALAIWEIGNNATNADGAPDPAAIDAAAIARLHEAATSMSDTAKRLAEARYNRASGPDLVGGKVPEGVASREQIQAAIDANPDGFRAYSRVMQGQADAIVAAADAKDTATLAQLVTSFDGACQACHEKYWYVAQ